MQHQPLDALHDRRSDDSRDTPAGDSRRTEIQFAELTRQRGSSQPLDPRVTQFIEAQVKPSQTRQYSRGHQWYEARSRQAVHAQIEAQEPRPGMAKQHRQRPIIELIERGTKRRNLLDPGGPSERG